MEEIKIGNARYIKDLNQTGIVKLIQKLGPISRKELADNTGYSAATISNHVKDLLEEGYVIETERGYSTGGRRPIYLTINPNKAFIFSLEIGVNNFKLYIFNLKLEIVLKKYFPLITQDTPEKMLSKIMFEMEEMLEEKGIDKSKLMGIGVAVPGLVNKEKGRLEFAPNLAWQGVEIVELLTERFSVPIILENEAKAAVMGERDFVYPEADNLVFVSINEGIGCGILFNGQLYRGASGNAGEFGHIIIESDGMTCHCGNKGCWETMASENYIIRRYNKLKGENKTKDQIYQLGKKGDKDVLEIFKETGENIAIGIANIINSLSPKLVVIGGSISKIKSYLSADIEKVLEEKTIAISYNMVKLKFSKLGDEAAVYGLASFIFQEKFNRI